MDIMTEVAAECYSKIYAFEVQYKNIIPRFGSGAREKLCFLNNTKVIL